MKREWKLALTLLVALCLAAATGCSGDQVVGEGTSVSALALDAPLFPVSVAEKIGFVDDSGRMIIKPQFYAAGDFSDGLAPVKVELGGRWGYIDKAGTLVIEPQFYGPLPFSEGLARAQVQKGGLVGYIDTTGKMVVQPQFRSAEDFHEGLAVVETADKGYFGYIDTTGAMVIEPVFDKAYSFSEGLASVSLASGRRGYIDRTGKWAITLDGGRGGDFSEGLAVITDPETGCRGYIDKTGSIVIEPQYFEANEFSEGLAQVALGASIYLDSSPRQPYYGYIDSSGTVIIEPKYYGWFHSQFSEGLTPVQLEQGGPYGYIDTTGAIVIEPKYFEAGPFIDGRAEAVVQEGESHSLIDKSGKVIWRASPPPTEWMPQFEDGVYDFQVDREDDSYFAGSESPYIRGGGVLYTAGGWQEYFASESWYYATDDGPVYRLVVTDQGEHISVESEVDGRTIAAQADRVTSQDGRLWYDVGFWAGGSLVIWTTEDGLQGELTVFGSGVPVVGSYRGSLTRSSER